MNSISLKEMGKGVGFIRIRRITGYLVGDLGKWGTSKRAELKDRVVHSSSIKNDI